MNLDAAAVGLILMGMFTGLLGLLFLVKVHQGEPHAMLLVIGLDLMTGVLIGMALVFLSPPRDFTTMMQVFYLMSLAWMFFIGYVVSKQ